MHFSDINMYYNLHCFGTLLHPFRLKIQFIFTIIDLTALTQSAENKIWTELI